MINLWIATFCLITPYCYGQLVTQCVFIGVNSNALHYYWSTFLYLCLPIWWIKIVINDKTCAFASKSSHNTSTERTDRRTLIIQTAGPPRKQYLQVVPVLHGVNRKTGCIAMSANCYDFHICDDVQATERHRSSAETYTPCIDAPPWLLLAFRSTVCVTSCRH